MVRCSAAFLVVLLGVAQAAATSPPKPDEPNAGVELPLAPLPKPKPRTPDTPVAGDLATIDELLARLASQSADDRQAARLAVTRGNESLVPAAAERLRRLGESTDKQALKKTLTALRVKAASKDSDEEIDAFALLMDHPEPASRNWRDLVSVLGLSRFLTAVATTEAARQLINIHVRFGEFLRVDTQRQLESLQLRSAAALIEATRHPAPKIASWASRELRKRGLNSPASLLQQTEGVVLADILRAYGFLRNPDLARTLISFASSSQVTIRQAAREAVATMGEVAHWPLRDAYEIRNGRKPPREWSWDRTARELFRAMDEMRLHDVLLAYQSGVAARKQGDLDAMRRHFDAVLTQAPNFEDAETLAAGYLEYALASSSSAPAEAADALRRARRLAQGEELRRRVDSLLTTLAAEELLARGITDQILFRRAVELDSTNERAQRGLASITTVQAPAPGRARRYATAGVIGALAALAVLLLLRRPKRNEDAPAAADPPRDA
jgi:hypothetical protein